MFQRAVEVNPTDRDAQYWLKRLTVAGLHEAPDDAVADMQQGSDQNDMDDLEDQTTGGVDEL
jgi:hypothetical protein